VGGNTLVLQGCAEFITNKQALTPAKLRILSANLEPLYMPEFDGNRKGVNKIELLRELIDSGIITKQFNVDTAKLEDKAKTDAILLFAGSYYTESEIRLFTLASAFH
jgi:hypothetical protein